VSPKFGKIFFGQLSCKIWAFSGKYHVKFGHFVNFSYIFFGQKCLGLKVDWASTSRHLWLAWSSHVSQTFHCSCLLSITIICSYAQISNRLIILIVSNLGPILHHFGDLRLKIATFPCPLSFIALAWSEPCWILQ